jgi:hypothetical protein
VTERLRQDFDVKVEVPQNHLGHLRFNHSQITEYMLKKDDDYRMNIWFRWCTDYSPESDSRCGSGAGLAPAEQTSPNYVTIVSNESELVAGGSAARFLERSI